MRRKNNQIDRPAKDGEALARRFYKGVSVELVGSAPCRYAILLDERPVRTPRKAPLAVPGKALADAIAAEWEAQGEHISPATMPLTRIANSVIDGVKGREAEVRDDILKFAACDLLCYRAESPAGLTGRQRQMWDPILSWAHKSLGARFVLAEGVMPVEQPAHALTRLGESLAATDAWRLAALHVVTTLTGSALLALAMAHGRISAGEAWAAAHVDEDWQIEQWGEDAEAAERRSLRQREFEAASRLLHYVNSL